MQYHVSTGLIIEHFKKENDRCPLCAIEKIVEQNICRELLADACMDDDVRAKSNALGYCEKHFDKLFSMQSKLGLALQSDTRMAYLNKKVFQKPKNAREAKKIAKELSAQTKTCLVCELVDREMIKYYKTLAQMFIAEPEAAELIKNSGGFCFKHYAGLLNYSDYAFLKSKNYLTILHETQQNRLKNHVFLLKSFANRHDYRNAGKPLGEAADALKKIHSDFYGEK